MQWQGSRCSKIPQWGEWIDEEREEDVGGAVNKELGGIEKKLKKKEFCSMESKLSGVSTRVA